MPASKVFNAFDVTLAILVEDNVEIGIIFIKDCNIYERSRYTSLVRVLGFLAKTLFFIRYPGSRI